MLANQSLPQGGRTQEQRSATTRRALLEAGRDAINELGYSRTTVAQVSKRAGLSRGAQIHHYPTKQKLMLAVADFILSDTEREVSELAKRLSDAAGPLDDTKEAIDAFVGEIWHRAFRRDKFDTILELINASRTDPVLHELLCERWQRLLGAYDKIGAQALGRMNVVGSTMSTVLNLTLCLIRGMATQRIVYDSDQSYYDNLIGAWTSIMHLAVHGGKARAL